MVTNGKTSHPINNAHEQKQNLVTNGMTWYLVSKRNRSFYLLLFNVLVKRFRLKFKKQTNKL